jgi:hypothetical protein
MWRPLSVTTNLGYDSSLLLISYNNKRYKLTFREKREANVSVKSAGSVSAL